MGFIAHIKGVRSHSIVRDAAAALVAMDHRGACGCEANTGDGAGMLTAIPDELMRAEAKRLFNVELPRDRPLCRSRRSSCRATRPSGRSARATLQKYVEAQGQKFIGWRPVPTDAKTADIGATAAARRAGDRADVRGRRRRARPHVRFAGSST